MKNFIFKSTNADLQKMFQSFETKLDVVSKNVLYSTHQMDFIRKEIMKLSVDKGLQKQVDSYFEDDEDETSPQTDQDHKSDPLGT